MTGLQVNGLGRRFGSRWALRDVSFECEDGLLGLVGPNGAGKTTLMRVLATLLPATTGAASWNGCDVGREGRAVRQVLGYLPQSFGVYTELTARSFLRYLSAMKGIPSDVGRRRTDEVLHLVNLDRDADRRLGAFSGGMLQRVGIAQALLNDPEMLIVDEPTSGLDPAERVRFRTMLAGLAEGRLVILSTHIVSDVESVAGRLILLREGRLLADTSPHELIASARGCVWSVTTDAAMASRLQSQNQVSGMVASDGEVTTRIVAPASPAAGAVPVEPTLEDAYLYAVNR